VPENKSISLMAGICPNTNFSAISNFEVAEITLTSGTVPPRYEFKTPRRNVMSEAKIFKPISEITASNDSLRLLDFRRL
jgi:hypothetical protein